MRLRHLKPFWWVHDADLSELRPRELELAEKGAAGLVRAATTSVAFPSLTDDDGKALCCVCRAPLAGRARRYCGEDCRNYAWICAQPSYARGQVYRRDKGICSECGKDTEAPSRAVDAVEGKARAQRELWMNFGDGRHDLSEHYRWWDRVVGMLHNYWGCKSALRRSDTFHNWEMEHVVPVSEGGGLCGLENLATNCLPCHKLSSARLAKRQADERKGQMTLGSLTDTP